MNQRCTHPFWRGIVVDGLDEGVRELWLVPGCTADRTMPSADFQEILTVAASSQITDDVTALENSRRNGRRSVAVVCETMVGMSQ